MIPDQLAALSHPKRLDLFRLLMRRYPGSVAAGQIAAALGLKANTASAYLATLRQAGLIDQQRIGTSLYYCANLPQIRTLFGGLMSDCCQNRPDLCLPFPDAPQTGAPKLNDPEMKDPEMKDSEMKDSGKPLNVLFLCTGNSARSIIAEAVLRTEGRGRFAAFSAGTRPAGRPHPDVIEVLREKAHDVSALSSKSLDVFSDRDAPNMDFIVTVCDAAANEECPVWPGHPISAHWGLPDPVAASDEHRRQAIEAAYDLLQRRIRALVGLKPDQMTLIEIQHAMDDIGRMQNGDNNNGAAT